MRILIFLTILCIGLGCNSAEKPNVDKSKLVNIKNDSITIAVRQKNDDEWTFDKVEHRSLFFKNGQYLETGLNDLEYIGQIPVKIKAPYVIFAGNLGEGYGSSIYIHSMSDSKFSKPNTAHVGFPYPDIQLAHDADSALYASNIVRAFYGYVLENTEGYVWYEQEISSDQEMISTTVHLSKLVNGSLKDTIFKDNNDTKLNETILFAESGICKEIRAKGELESVCAH